MKANEFSIVKKASKEQMVFGFFNLNKVGDELVEDLQNDLLPTEELEKAAYNYVLNARVQGEMHVRKGVGRLVESFMMTYEKMDLISKYLDSLGIPNTLQTGCEGWFGGFKVEDEKVWQEIEAGNYPAFSVGGGGTRVPMEDQDQ